MHAATRERRSSKTPRRGALVERLELATMREAADAEILRDLLRSNEPVDLTLVDEALTRLREVTARTPSSPELTAVVDQCRVLAAELRLGRGRGAE